MPLPSGPSSSVEAQTFAWFSRPHAFLAECQAQFGDCFTLRVQGWGTQVVVSHPDAIRQVFTAEPDVLHAGNNDFLRPLFREGSLLVLDGERHRRTRKLLMPAFHGSALKRYSRAIADTTKALMRAWPLDQPMPMQEKLLELSLEVAMLAIFGLREAEARYHPVKKQLTTLMKAVSTSITLASAERSAAAARFDSIRSQLDALLAEELAHRRAHPDATRTDVLALLMEARDEAGQPMSEGELRDELITLLLAGHDTTANELAWALLALDANPEARDRLVEDVDKLGPSPDPDALVRRPLLGATVNEVLRLHPVVPAVSRKVMKPFRVAGHVLEPGTGVAPAIFLAHRRAESFPEPEAFRPERFMERDPSPFEYLPFGGGTRRCIGMGFALHQMKLVLGTVLGELELHSAMRHPVREVRHGVLVGPSEGARMIARRRPEHARRNTMDKELECGTRS
ncbi:MAG TPA: cytochrome P450 [Myxococcaceae bacterium]|nr:cytochrome P450 [Myxococcaceae bacterium]